MEAARIATPKFCRAFSPHSLHTLRTQTSDHQRTTFPRALSLHCSGFKTLVSQIVHTNVRRAHGSDPTARFVFVSSTFSMSYNVKASESGQSISALHCHTKGENRASGKVFWNKNDMSIRLSRVLHALSAFTSVETSDDWVNLRLSCLNFGCIATTHHICFYPHLITT